MFDRAAQPMIQLSNVEKSYGSAAAEVRALRGVSINVAAGERVALLGKSGSGKSTLLNLIGALDQPTAGEVVVDGRNVAAISANEAARHRLESVGMIFQAYHLVPSRSAIENVELPMIFAAVSPRERRAAAIAALDAVGLSERMEHRPSELSGGERQRVAIARALVNRPHVLLADEPTGNLDSDTADEIVQLLMEHVERNSTTVVLVTHDEQLATRAANRVVRLKDGLIEQ